MSQITNDQQSEQIKEPFCGACVAVPFALLGAGTAALGSQKKGSYQKYRKIMLWGGIIVTIVSILIALWFMRSCKTCSAK